jgi:hypothetical protein
MKDEIRFLREKAEQLRILAGAEPHLAEELRRLADELDEMADRLSGRNSNGNAASH